MKKLLLVPAVLLVCTSTFAQKTEKFDAAIGKFQAFYNKQQADSIFSLFSERSKELMPREKTGMVFGQVFKQLGELKSYKYEDMQDGLAWYKTTFANATLSTTISLDKDDKLETFRFVPYQDKSPGKAKSNFIYKSPNGNIYGTVTEPPLDSRQVPVVLIIAGSGPTDRNGNNPLDVSANTYQMIADSLQLAGIACVRYDKRGIGESVGAATNEENMRFDDMVNDAVGIIKMLKQNKAYSKVIVLGHSEGSLVGMIAAGKEKVDGYISMSGLSEPADKTMEKQYGAQSAELAKKARVIMDSIKKGYTPKDLAPLEMAFHTSVQPYLRSWFLHDPAQEINKVTCPVLIVQGTTDIQVGVDQAERLKKIYPAAKLKIIPGMSHILKEGPTDRQKNAATYSDPNLPLMPGLMKEIDLFVNKINHTK